VTALQLTCEATSVVHALVLLEPPKTTEGTGRFEVFEPFEFIPLSFWYDAPLTSQDCDRRHDPWLVYGSPTYSPARWSFSISPA
jgi:hypothetical protein